MIIVNCKIPAVVLRGESDPEQIDVEVLSVEDADDEVRLKIGDYTIRIDGCDLQTAIMNALRNK